MAVENIVRKGKIACKKQFILFSVFSTLYGTYCSMHFKMLSAVCFNLDQSKIFSSGNGLIAIPRSKILIEVLAAKRS